MRKPDKQWRENVNEQAAVALVSSAFAFLLKQGFGTRDLRRVVEGAFRAPDGRGRPRTKKLAELIKIYEEMGILLSTWYTDRRFLDSDGNVLPLAPTARGRLSVGALIRASGITLDIDLAMPLLRRSPSISFDTKGWCVAVKRAFVLEDFEIPRAALIVERFLETLRTNTVGRNEQSPILLERSCYVTSVDRRRMLPLLRDIRSQGIAFMNAVDGEIEAHRMVRKSKAATGAMGVVTFAWIQDKLSPRRRG